MSDHDQATLSPTDAPVAEATMGLQAPVEAIASNVAIAHRVAPDIAQTSVIDDMYAFADRLRAGSGRRSLD